MQYYHTARIYRYFFLLDLRYFYFAEGRLWRNNKTLLDNHIFVIQNSISITQQKLFKEVLHKLIFTLEPNQLIGYCYSYDIHLCELLVSRQVQTSTWSGVYCIQMILLYFFEICNFIPGFLFLFSRFFLCKDLMRFSIAHCQSCK